MKHPYKYALLGVCLLLTLIGCKQPKNLFTLEGELKNTTSDTLYLFGTVKPFDRIDTIPLNKGTFHYETELDTLHHLTLVYNNGNTLPLFANKGLAVTLNGDANQPDSIQIKGGKENEELSQFMDSIRSLKDSLQLITAAADSFITRHPSSQVSILLLDNYFLQTPEPNYMRIDQLIEGMSGILHDHPLIKEIQGTAENNMKVVEGRHLPSFRMQNLQGKNLTTYQYRDKIIVVTFWASWNQQSVEVKRELEALQKKLKKEKELVFIFVSLDMDYNKWKQTTEKDTIYGDQVCDGKGWESNLTKQFGIEQIPTITVLSAQRNIIERSHDTEGLEELLKEQLKKEKERKEKEERNKRKRR